MATERRRLAPLIAALPALALLALPVTVRAAQPWWQPLAFAGQRVSDVAVSGGQVAVTVNGAGYSSSDRGGHFAPAPPPPPPAAPVTSAGRVWEIRDGKVLSGTSTDSLRPDPRAPFLGTTAHLVAAPAAIPGVVLAVGSDGHVWRRGQGGGWATALVLLPGGGISGVPAITALTAFTQPLSGAVYLGTDGYGVLLSSDGGDDWIRAEAGLPENVLSLATDSSSRTLYAATADGLWVHRLQSFPAPPVYRDAALYLRWLGIGAVGLGATVLAIIALGVALQPRRQRRISRD
jgi:hypothetical protein